MQRQTQSLQSTESGHRVNHSLAVFKTTRNIHIEQLSTIYIHYQQLIEPIRET